MNSESIRGVQPGKYTIVPVASNALARKNNKNDKVVNVSNKASDDIGCDRRWYGDKRKTHKVLERKNV